MKCYHTNKFCNTRHSLLPGLPASTPDRPGQLSLSVLQLLVCCCSCHAQQSRRSNSPVHHTHASMHATRHPLCLPHPTLPPQLTVCGLLVEGIPLLLAAADIARHKVPTVAQEHPVAHNLQVWGSEVGDACRAHAESANNPLGSVTINTCRAAGKHRLSTFYRASAHTHPACVLILRICTTPCILF